MSFIRRRPGVDEDVFEQTLFLMDESENVARRYVDAVEKTLKDLAQRPGMGSPKNLSGELAQVRSWWVDGFRNHLIYYIALPDGIEVLAIVHGAREVEKLLRGRL